MKLLNTILLVLLLSVPVFVTSAKDSKDLVTANYYYNHYAYSQAIPFFEKIADELKDPLVYTRLGDCYNIAGNFQKAAESYGKAVLIKGCGNDILLRYAQLLMQLTQYDDAEKWLIEYKKVVSTDRRADNLIAGCRMALAHTQDKSEGIISLLPFNTDGSEFAPTLWKGQLVFASDTAIDLKKKKDRSTGHSYYNIYSIDCDNNGNCADNINSLTASKGVNIKYHNGPCTFSADGKQMYYTRSVFKNRFIGSGSVSNKDSFVVLEIMIASDFDTAEKKFNTIIPFQYNSKEYAVAHPSVSPNGKVLAFSSNMPKGQGRSDIYLCKKMGVGRWSKPQSAGVAVNTEGDEVFPYWADNETLYFSSDGQTGFGGLDIYKCKWDEQSNTFSVPQNIGTPINSSYDDISLAINTDSGSTWFSSNRPAEKAGDNIFFYSKRKVYLQLHITDAISRQPVDRANITLASPKESYDTIAINGDYFRQMSPGQVYNIEVTKAEYEANKLSVTTTGNKLSDTIIRTVLLTKKERPRDTIAVLTPQALVLRNTNVMDSPGVKGFTVGATYEVGDFSYDYNKYELTAFHQRYLDTLLVQLKRNPNMRMEIQAHTDCRGSVASNKILSEKRAQSVVNYLIRHGIAAKRLQYVGLGNSQPKVLCPDCNSCTEEQHHLNRILEFKVLQL